MSSSTEARSRKRELKKLNQLIWEGKTDVFAIKPPLDTSFKKNTALIKRFRTSLTPDNTTSLLKDIATVSLEKYLPEVISAVSEGLLKAKLAGDINAAIEVVSALHQRFGKAFTPFIVWNIAKGLSTPGKEQLRSLPTEQREKEESARLARQRVLLRVATELWLVGVIRTLDDAVNPEESSTITGGSKAADATKKQSTTIITRSGDDEPLPLEALKDILARDREGVNLPLVVLFVKSFAWDVLGVKSRTVSRKGGAEDGPSGEAESVPQSNGHELTDPLDQPLTEPSVQTRYRNILSTYFSGISKYIQNEHHRLHQQAKRNSEAYVRSGEVFEDRQQAFEKATRVHEKLIANAQVVAEVLGLDMPDLSDEEEAKEAGEGMIRETGSMFKKGDELAANGMWEDDDQRRFYEDLIDLRARVPSVLLDEGRKAASGPVEKSKEEDPAKSDPPESTDDELAAKAGDLDLNGEKSEDRDTSIANKTIGAQVDALLIRLPEQTNRDLIDSFAFDFCFLNSKASRNRLIKVLEDIPRGRSDLLPYYARLIATLGKAGLTDIVSAMVTYLDKEFRSLQKRKEKEQLTAVRTQNAKYFSEMTKFGLVPEHVIFHCFKVALDDFSRMNIDIICTLLEGCGRYLLRTSTTHPRMVSFLETLQRKKDAHHLSPQDRIMIENAFYYVNPPERPSIVAKERSPAELYVRKLIYLDMNKKNYNKTIKSLRKLHWEDPDIVHMLIKVCTKIWKVKYSNVFLIAILVFGLFRYHQDFGIRVVDAVLENIRVGLEENDYRMNQRRIATIKYLGELYNYKMIDSPVIFDTLYLILCYGYEGTPRPGLFVSLDPPDNHFRIRLVCTLLDTCGECFDRGSSKKKLDFFLAFFQYYIHIKERVPMDIEFMVQDTFQLVRPNWVLHNSLEEAGKAFQEATAKIYGPAEAADDDSSSTEDAAGSDAEDDEIKLSDDEMEMDNEPGSKEANNDNHAGDDDDDSDSDEDSSESGDLEDDVVYSRPQEYRDPEADADFDREFSKLMSESLESRKFERKTVFDVPLPIKKAINAQLAPQPTSGFTMAMLEEEEEEEAPPATKPGIMTFSLLTKRGNKQQTRDIELPSDSTFAIAMKSKQEQEREERQRIKDRVLQFERMEEDPDPLASTVQRPNTNGANLKYGDKNKTIRGKKLQLGDFNWYDENPNQSHRNKRDHGFNRGTDEVGETKLSCGSPIQQLKNQVAVATPLHPSNLENALRNKDVAQFSIQNVHHASEKSLLAFNRPQTSSTTDRKNPKLATQFKPTRTTGRNFNSQQKYQNVTHNNPARATYTGSNSQLTKISNNSGRNLGRSHNTDINRKKNRTRAGNRGHPKAANISDFSRRGPVVQNGASKQTEPNREEAAYVPPSFNDMSWPELGK